MKCSFTLLLLIVSLSAFSQNRSNYLKFRDEVFHPICGWRDSLSAAEVTAEMRAVDTTLIRKNIEAYYTDLSIVESQWYAYSGDTSTLRSAANHAVAALYHDPVNASGLWGAAFNFQRLGECDKTNYFLKLYEERVPERYRSNTEQIALLKKRCL